MAVMLGGFQNKKRVILESPAGEEAFLNRKAAKCAKKTLKNFAFFASARFCFWQTTLTHSHN